MQYPYWTVEGRRFNQFDLADAFASRMARELEYPVPVMEKLDDMTPAYTVVTKQPKEKA